MLLLLPRIRHLLGVGHIDVLVVGECARNKDARNKDRVYSNRTSAALCSSVPHRTSTVRLCRLVVQVAPLLRLEVRSEAGGF